MRTNLRSTRFSGALTAALLGGLMIGAALTWAAPPPGKGGGGGGGGETPSISYSYLPLGTLGAMDGQTPWSYAVGLNNLGDVVGLTTTSYGPGTAPVLWTAAGGKIDLNDLIHDDERKHFGEPDDIDGWVLQRSGGINDFGQIAGSGYKFQNGVPGLARAFRLDPPTTDTGFWTIVDLGNLGGNNGTAVAAPNNSGDVTGYSVANDGQYHMFLVLGDDENHEMHDLGAYQGNSTFANSISNRTEGVIQIVGRSPSRALRCTCTLNGDGVSHEYQDLGTLKDDNSGVAQAWGVNDLGQIVGSASANPTKGNDNERAFLVGASGMVNLGTLSTGRTWNDSSAYDVNNNGEVVGESMTVFPYLEAFYYSSATGMVNLEQAVTTLPPSLRGLIAPMAINDNGVVCGPRIFNFNGYDREAFILTPNIPDL